MAEKLIVATYLNQEEKNWLQNKAKKDMRSMAFELRMLVREQMCDELDKKHK